MNHLTVYLRLLAVGTPKDAAWALATKMFPPIDVNAPTLIQESPK